MISIPMECDFEIPKWDVALEALMKDEYVNNQQTLSLEDIERLAINYAVRFDDMIITALTVLVEKAWHYKDENGEIINFNYHDLEQLYKGGRVKKKNVAHLTGVWIPGSPDHEP